MADDPVILIPGLACDARLFLHAVIHLSPDRPVMVHLPTQGPTIEAMSQAVLDMAPPRFVLIGHGLGGNVALDVIRRAPDRVVRLVLISADPLAEAPQIAAAREQRMVAARVGRLAESVAQEVPPDALADGPGRVRVPQRLQEMGLHLGPEVYQTQSRALQRRPDQQKTLRRAMLPALVLAGAWDSLVTPRRQEFVAQLMPHATFQVLSGSGHLPTLEQPEVVTAALRAFLAGPMLLR